MRAYERCNSTYTRGSLCCGHSARSPHHVAFLVAHKVRGSLPESHYSTCATCPICASTKRCMRYTGRFDKLESISRNRIAQCPSILIKLRPPSLRTRPPSAHDTVGQHLSRADSGRSRPRCAYCCCWSARHLQGPCARLSQP